MRILSAIAVLGLASAALTAQTAPPATHLKVGDPAPDFTVRSTDGGNFKLSDFKGKQPVVVAFMPAAFSGG